LGCRRKGEGLFHTGRIHGPAEQQGDRLPGGKPLLAGRGRGGLNKRRPFGDQLNVFEGDKRVDEGDLQRVAVKILGFDLYGQRRGRQIFEIVKAVAQEFRIRAVEMKQGGIGIGDIASAGHGDTGTVDQIAVLLISDKSG